MPESYREVTGVDGLVNPNVIQRVSDSAFIPKNPENRDYKAFLEWQTAGGVIEPYVPPAQTPEQAHIAMLRAQVIDPALPLSQKFHVLLVLLGYAT